MLICKEIEVFCYGQ